MELYTLCVYEDFNFTGLREGEVCYYTLYVYEWILMYVPMDFNNSNNKISSDALVLHYCIANHTLYVYAWISTNNVWLLLCLFFLNNV